MKMSRRLAIVLLLLSAHFGRANGQTLNTLYSFTGGSDGCKPSGRLVQGSDGSFYGTTEFGGNTNSDPNGCGTVFRITPNGSLTNLHSFSGSDGYNPFAGLVQGGDGNFYGTTYHGGTSKNCNFGCGTVFRISPSGNLTNLHSFIGSDGVTPTPDLVQGGDGNFYGTTYSGGASNYGTVFRISPNGNFTNLYSLSGSDGSDPIGGLVQDNDGNFYGTTYTGGAGNYGTVFRINPSGSLTNLYSFSGGSDGRLPVVRLLLGSDGNFYGAIYRGGASNTGTVFRVSPSGTLTNLYSFNGSDGANPCAGLVQGSGGDFYGITYYGGSNGFGTVFRFYIPLNPPANQISAIQLSGNDLVISLPSVAGETYQLQFSDSMSPTNWTNVVGASVTNSLGSLLTLTNFGGASQPQGFYRFDITP